MREFLATLLICLVGTIGFAVGIVVLCILAGAVVLVLFVYGLARVARFAWEK